MLATRSSLLDHRHARLLVHGEGKFYYSPARARCSPSACSAARLEERCCSPKACFTARHCCQHGGRRGPPYMMKRNNSREEEEGAGLHAATEGRLLASYSITTSATRWDGCSATRWRPSHCSATATPSLPREAVVARGAHVRRLCKDINAWPCEAHVDERVHVSAAGSAFAHVARLPLSTWWLFFGV
ncbi:hypothetical protein Dimus_030420 [Dionaea muscipula]